MTENKMTLDKEEQVKLEHITMFEAIERAVIKLSKKEMYRVICLLVAPESRELKYLKRLKTPIVKQVYLFGTKCLSVKYASLFSKLAKQQKEEEENKQ